MTHGSLLLIGGGIFSVFAVILGFIALVKQKTYIDPETQKPTEVDVPFFGKLKTNYPSLVFVFLGFALAFFVVQKAQNATQIWDIEGRFTSDNPDQIWTPANFDLHPKIIAPVIDRDTGKFSIKLEIPRGQSFEDAYSVIGYTDGSSSASINTKQALDDFGAEGRNFIEISQDYYRRYHPIKIQDFNP